MEQFTCGSDVSSMTLECIMSKSTPREKNERKTVENKRMIHLYEGKTYPKVRSQHHRVYEKQMMEE